MYYIQSSHDAKFNYYYMDSTEPFLTKHANEYRIEFKKIVFKYCSYTHKIEPRSKKIS